MATIPSPYPPVPLADLPLSIANGGTGQITAAAAIAALGGVPTSDLPLSLANGGTGQITALAALEALFAAQTASITLKPTNPANITTTTEEMFGLGAAVSNPLLFTPTGTGIVKASITCLLSVETAAQPVLIGPRYGLVSGGVPANAAAATGTRWGTAADEQERPAVNSATAGVIYHAEETLILVAADAYWFDLAGAEVTSGDAIQIMDVVLDLTELAR